MGKEFNKYDKIGDYHWSYYGAEGHYTANVDLIVEELKGKVTLDIGAGDGLILSKLAKGSMGFDSSRTACLLAEKHGIKVEHLSVENFRVENWKSNQKFDAILIGDTLEHIDDPVSCLVKAKKALKKTGGKILVSVPAPGVKDENADHVVSVKTFVEWMAKAGFVAIKKPFVKNKRLYFIGKHTPATPKKAPVARKKKVTKKKS